MSNFDHLLSAEAPKEIDILELLKDKVQAYKTSEAEVALLTERLEEATKKFQKISQEDIPTILLQNGLSEIRLASGEKLQVKQEISASIANQEELTEFLNKRGDDDIVKTTMELGKLPKEILQNIRMLLLQDFNLTPELKQTVHNQTLKKYVRETCKIGETLPEDYKDDRYIPLQELPDCIKVFTFFKTTIK